jgi:3-dehydroquinate dehydratase-2
MCRAVLPDRRIEFRQTNSETELIEWVHAAIDTADGIVINPAAFSFTSLALLDALKMFPGPIVEVHISNICTREAHYHHSYVSLAASGVIAGLGAAGYVAAVRAVAALIEQR